MTNTLTVPEPGAPNLDAMDACDLWNFGIRAEMHPRIVARELAFSGKRSVRASKDLGHYAVNKSVAMQCRLKGDIQAASIYEAICDRIYDGLPSFARW